MALQLNETEKGFFTKLFEQTSQGTGRVGAGDAVVFLRQSGLDDTILHQVWALSDPEGAGELDQDGFHVAMKLIALAQNNVEVSVSNVGEATPLPDFGPDIAAIAEEVKASLVSAPAAAPSNGDWLVEPEEKARYDNVFSSLQPSEGKISGVKAKQVLVNSKLPNSQLGVIWEIADIDKDGMLDQDEFAVAMYLVYKCLEGKPCPQSMPPGLMPPSKRGAATGKPPAPDPSTSAPPAVASGPTTSTAGGWCVTADELKTYNGFFASADKDHDGLVSGGEVMQMFMSSKLDKATLAKVWSLCDMNTTGTLNSEQFALAMHLISRKVKGVDVPDALEPQMIPPSMRPGGSAPAPAAAPTPSAAAPPASASATAQREQSQAAAELADAKKQLESEVKMVKDLESQVSKQKTDTKDQEAELAKVKAELSALKQQEASLRQEFKDGKAKLAKLVEDIKAVKAEKAKKAKSSMAAASPSRPAKAPDTHGMSMQDYFGAGNAAPAKDPFGADPF